MLQRRWIAIGVAMCIALPAAAAPSTRQLSQCVSIDDPVARLTCYDAAMGRRAPARIPGAPPPMPPVVTNAPSLTRPVVPRPGPEPRIIDGRIVAVAPAGNGLFRFQLADGSVWRTGEQASAAPRAGETVHIQRSVLAYYAAIGGRSVIGVRPVR